MSWIRDLHATLDKRVMPEDVARIILGSNGWAGIPAPLWHELARVSHARPLWYWSSMRDDFERPDDCSALLTAAGRIFGYPADGIDPADPDQVGGFLNTMGALIGWGPGQDWHFRMNREQRAEYAVYHPALAGMSRRQYDKRYRALLHLEDKATRMYERLRFRRLVLIGRSGFAADIEPERFERDPMTACLIAYLAARKNRRRLFTLSSKENPVDGAAQMMLDYVLAAPGSDFEMLAMVHPRPEILARMDEVAVGSLMGAWWEVMRECAGGLKQAWPGDPVLDGTGRTISGVNPLTMIVHRGMDSSTWNTMASAYNAARAGWLNCATASAATQGLTGPFLPGKVMRLMAADLAWWHQASGGDVDPDTQVWARLPKPWTVMDGSARCTRADVEAACAEAGVDAAARGWTAPRADGAVAVFTPTPELVHGVTIASPEWAALLRRAGVFAGPSKGAVRGLDGIEVPDGVVTGELPVRDEAGNYYGTSGG